MWRLQPEAHRLVENRDECALAEQIGLGGPVPRRDETRSEPLDVWAALPVPVSAWGERRRRGRCCGGDGVLTARLGKGE